MKARHNIVRQESLWISTGHALQGTSSPGKRESQESSTIRTREEGTPFGTWHLLSRMRSHPTQIPYTSTLLGTPYKARERIHCSPFPLPFDKHCLDGTTDIREMEFQCQYVLSTYIRLSAVPSVPCQLSRSLGHPWSTADRESRVPKDE